MSSIPSLDAVAQDFEAWRLTKKTAKERTPLALCIAAAHLMSHYPTKQILERLNISFQALKMFSKKITETSDVATLDRTSGLK